MRHLRRFSLFYCLTVSTFTSWIANAQTNQEQTFELDPVLVAANRINQLGSDSIDNSDYRIDLNSVRFDNVNDISELLADNTAFSTFRRTSSYAAHPTTQGVRLRNLGATATSRALVLYDGVPQNDPFGGWVYWHQINPNQIEDIYFNTGGLGTSWGNMGSGGLISLISANPGPGTSTIDASVGTSGTLGLNASSSIETGSTSAIDFSIRHFQTDGFHTLRESQRGLLDVPSNSEGNSINARLRLEPTEDWKLQFAVRGFEENRDNGTPVSVNDTEALNISAIGERSIDSTSRVNFALYHQDRSFRNVFASVASDRATERPALEQYDVPAEATGGAFTYTREGSSGVSFTIGTDARRTKGSVNERFRNLGAGFTRDRHAGGEQNFIGGFAQLSGEVSTTDFISATLRVDRVANKNATRIETDTTNNNVLRNDVYQNRSDNSLSSNLNWRHAFSDTTSSNVSLFTGFRAPTLNELYRPFRVRNDITEANPLLENEESKGLELSISTEEQNAYQLKLAAFHTRVDNMIANALITTASGFDPRFGFIPGGGSGSQRVNLDKTTIAGFEIQGSFFPNEFIRIDTSVTLADTKVDSDFDLPQFNGKEFPQSSPLRARLSVEWKASDKWNLWSDTSWSDDAYDDLGNTRSLNKSFVSNIGGRYDIDENNSVGFVIENLFDAEVVSGRASNNLVTIDAGREARIVWSYRK